MKRIYPKWWDSRLQVFVLKNKDLIYDDVLLKLEHFNGSWSYAWVEKELIS